MSKYNRGVTPADAKALPQYLRKEVAKLQRAAAALGTVTEDDFSFSDVTTADATTSKHGLSPKLSGVATEFYNGAGGFTVPAGSGGTPPAFPTPGVGVLGRWSAKFSTVTLSADGSFCAKITDLSGNGYDSDTMTGTARPRWLGSAFNRGYPGLRFNGTSQRLTFATVPGLPSPLTCTIIAVVQNYTTGTVNKHLVNWAGNPIVFLGSGPAYVLYNGTLESSGASYTQVTGDLPPDVLSHPVLMICEFNGAAGSSKLTLGATDYGFGSAGTGATGGTNHFTIGSDSGSSPSNFAGMLLAEMCVCPGILTGPERAALATYYADPLVYRLATI